MNSYNKANSRKKYYSPLISHPLSDKIHSFPLKSSSLNLSSINFEKDSSRNLGLSCEIISQITPNIFSFGNISGSEKCESLLIKTLPPDFDISAKLPLDTPLGANITSKPLDLRDIYNSLLTFSSNKNLTLGCCAEDDIIFPFSNLYSIMQGCLDMFLCEWPNKSTSNFIDRNASFKQFKNLPDHYSSAFKSRSSTTDFTIHNNVFVNFNSHNRNNN